MSEFTNSPFRPGAVAGINDDITSMTALTQITRATGGSFDIATGNTASDNFTINTDQLIVQGETGHVGIGVTPSYRLDINSGFFRMGNFLYTPSTWIGVKQDSGMAAGMRYGALAISSSYVNIPPTNGLYVQGLTGIGTVSPAAKLSINGGLHVGGDSDPGDNNLLVDGTGYFTGALTAASYTDNTPAYEGEAVVELKKIKTDNGKIDHDSLPIFAKRNVGKIIYQRTLDKKIIINQTEAFEDIIKINSVNLKDINGEFIIDKIETVYKIEDGEIVSFERPIYKTEEIQIIEKTLKPEVSFNCETGKFYTQNEIVTEIQEDKLGRDLGAMISILTVAVQELASRIEELENNYK